jgi:protein O-mannosyl-transferase
MSSPVLRLAGSAAAMLAAALVYLNALDNPFVYDDVRTVEENRSVVALDDLRTIVLGHLARPVVNLSYAMDRAVWGAGPFGFHVTNLVLHVLNVGLLFALTWALVTDRRPPGGSPTGRPALAAFVAAALFAVHPLMTEAVGYVSGRSELLAAVFVFAAFLAARRWMEGRGAGWLVLTFIAWVLALGSKEVAIVLPLVLFFYDRVLRPDLATRRRRYLWLLHAPMWTIAAAAAVVRVMLFVRVEYPGGTTVEWAYALTVLDVFRRYLVLLVAPSGQSIFHAIPATTSLAEPRAIAAVAVGVAWVALIVATARRRYVGSLGLLWFAAVLAPSSVLLLLDRGEPMAEHRVYLASAGLFLVAGSLAGGVAQALAPARRFTRMAVAAAGLVVLVALAGRTVLRNAIWSSPVLLWAEAAERAPAHWLPALVLGESLHAAGRHTEAILSLEQARALGPNVPAILANLGLCQLEVGARGEAAATFAALQALDPRSAAASNGLAMAALLGGDHEAARRGFLATLDIAPRSIEARRGLVLVEERAGPPPSAEAFRRCEEIRLLAPDAPGVDACLERHQAAAAP